VFVQADLYCLTFTDVRRLLIKTIPTTLKHATAGGGLFAYMGLSGDPARGAGLIVANKRPKPPATEGQLP